MKEELSKWEQQLWDLVCKGDGSNCPLYDRCTYRKQGQWCVAEHIPEVTRLLDVDPEFDLDSIILNDSREQRPGTPFYLVNKLANRFLKIQGVQSPPVPGNLAGFCDRKRPIEIREVPLKFYHGAIWYLSDRWVIHLNSNDQPEIKRHTLFHEAFHIMAHCNGNPVFKKTQPDGSNFNEAMADYFAMCVMMPRKWVIERWPECEDVPRMAKIFDVPLPYMGLRLKWLNLI